VTCTDFLSKMTDYFDGKIAPDLLQEVRAHLCECSHCEVVVNTTRQTIEVYRDNEIYEFSPELRDRLRSAIMAKCVKSGV
jgi:anti-sigma factor RsiW